MYLASLKQKYKTKEMVTTFRGYCHRDVIADGQWYEMRNMSTRKYPAISTREKRRKITKIDGKDSTNVSDICDMGGLVWIDTKGALHAGGHTLEGFLKIGAPNANPYARKRVPMGAYLTVWPDKIWANIEKLRKLTVGESMTPGIDYGNIDAAWEQKNDAPGADELYGVTITPCQRDGSYWKYIPKNYVEAQVLPRISIEFPDEKPAGVVITSTYPWTIHRLQAPDKWGPGVTYYGYYIGSDEKPEDPDDGCLWMDDSGDKPVLYQWYGSTRMWGPVDCYVKIEPKDGDLPFAKGDAVTIRMPQVFFNADTLHHVKYGKGVDLGYYGSRENPLGENGWWNNAVLQEANSEWMLVKGTIDRQTVIGSYHRQLVNCYLELSYWYGQKKAEEEGGDPPAMPKESVAWAMQDEALISKISDMNLYLDNPVIDPDDLAALYISRRSPDMDFVIECGNRLWGCYYGKGADGKILNEIYASKLGDFKNWNYFAGLSTDSYVASRGAPGEWTGAIAMGTTPLFFKRDRLEKVYISASGAHQITSAKVHGVQPGSSKSLQIVDNVLFYLSDIGVMAYDGSVPELCSADFGDVRYKEGTAGKRGSVYYLQAKTDNQARSVFCLDTATGIWCKEDGMIIRDAVEIADALYLLLHDWTLIAIGAIPETVKAEEEEDFDWELVSGPIGYYRAEQEYLLRLIPRLKLDPGASAMVHVMYDDDGNWRRVACLEHNSTHSVTVPIKTRRCDHFRIKLSGIGGVTIYSLTREIEKGSLEA